MSELTVTLLVTEPDADGLYGNRPVIVADDLTAEQHEQLERWRNAVWRLDGYTAIGYSSTEAMQRSEWAGGPPSQAAVDR